MNKKYWLRFAIWFVVIHAILYFGYTLFLGEEVNTMAGIPLLLMDIIGVILMEVIGISGRVALFFCGTLQWFIIGAFIGWLCEKIKNRNRLQS